MNDNSFMNENNLPAPLPEDAEKKPGSQREDASAWDRLSDGQRRLIAFGVLLALILAMVLAIGTGSSGGCALCGSCGTVSDSDTSEPDRITAEIVPEDEDKLNPLPLPSGTDLPAVNEDAPTQPEAPGTVVPSGSDLGVITPVSPTDAPDEESATQTQTGFFDAWNHEADNEAGGGNAPSHTGFLGFLFGCTGCGESCNISIADSLTDPIEGEESGPDRDNTGLVSGSDAEEDIWPQQPDDNAYIAMLSEQLAVISDDIIRLSAMDGALSQFTDPQRVRDNDSFRRLTEEMLLWCEGAEKYDASALTDAQALECNQLSRQLAGHLRGYIEDYPQLITGAVSGTDLVSRADQINTIMADIVALYDALSNTPAEQPAE